jgi:hypothetical protein
VFGSKLITTPLRKATKVVVYTAVPGSALVKTAAMGTRNSRLSAKEAKKQTKLLEEIARQGRQ